MFLGFCQVDVLRLTLTKKSVPLEHAAAVPWQCSPSAGLWRPPEFGTWHRKSHGEKLWPRGKNKKTTRKNWTKNEQNKQNVNKLNQWKKTYLNQMSHFGSMFIPLCYFGDSKWFLT